MAARLDDDLTDSPADSFKAWLGGLSIVLSCKQEDGRLKDLCVDGIPRWARLSVVCGI